MSFTPNPPSFFHTIRLVDSLRLIHPTQLVGAVYMNMHYGKALWVGDGKLANLVTNAVYDDFSKQPEFKFSAVSVSKTAPDR